MLVGYDDTSANIGRSCETETTKIIAALLLPRTVRRLKNVAEFKV
jgi:hypothetical protein